MSFIDQQWTRVLPAKVIGGTLCAFGGLSLGREGPSIQLGAMAGKAIAGRPSALDLRGCGRTGCSI